MKLEILKNNQCSSIMCNGFMKYSVLVWVSTEMLVVDLSVGDGLGASLAQTFINGLREA